MKTALKVVENVFNKQELRLWSDEAGEESHSLHYAISYPESIKPEAVRFFVERFSQRGEVVLDPFCASGATALEANMLGRVAVLSDANPFAIRIAQAKASATDITDVTLRLQQINMRRPVDVKAFDQNFSPFFDVDTFREVVNLKSFLHGDSDRTARFIELIACGLLHGHTAGYFSVYSFPHLSLSPQEQHELNLKRGQVPDYRSVIPRILRKTAAVLRDGIPSAMRQSEIRNQYLVSDARDLSRLASDSINLVVTAPPLPNFRDPTRDMWLRLWFMGLKADSLPGSAFAHNNLQSWLDFMNETLLELSRVTRRGGRIVLDLAEAQFNDTKVCLAESVAAMVDKDLCRFLEAEALLIHKGRSVALKHKINERSDARSKKNSRVLVLRRR
ncbi:MAG: hypothetical protein KDD42_07550 [Bdellovibrionales bacterium]|nr:hypothetical protein [Bdellovibrionales bacterium]